MTEPPEHPRAPDGLLIALTVATKVGVLVLGLVAAWWVGAHLPNPLAAWDRWDAPHYTDIAVFGYALKQQYSENMELGAACKLGAKVLGADGDPLDADQLEVALLDCNRPRRAFRRIKGDELTALLS